MVIAKFVAGLAFLALATIGSMVVFDYATASLLCSGLLLTLALRQRALDDTRERLLRRADSAPRLD